MNKFSFNNEGNFNIGIITSPISQSGCIPTSQLLDIIRGISKNVCLITGNYGYEYFLKDHRIKTYGIYYRNRKNTFFRVCKYIQAQLQISSLLIKASKNVEIWIFFIGGDSLVFPMAVAKLLGKKVILSFASSSAQTHAASKDDLSIILKFLSNFNCRLTDCIVLYSESLINEWDLKKYQNKIIIAPRHFLDFNNYKMNEEIQRNNNLVGYIGRLSREKGVMNFVESIPIILKENPNLEFILIGDGALKKEIELYIEKNNLQHKVKVKGWVQHEKIPDCLNKLKLLILPSYTEGLPNIMIEAMACNTIVLATPVGSIPSIIKDKETGFIMETNTPKCISDNVIRVFNDPNLENILNNANSYVKENFSYTSALKKYEHIIYGPFIIG